MRGLEKRFRFLVGRGSVNPGVTHACHSPWRHPTNLVLNTVAPDPFFPRASSDHAVDLKRHESAALLRSSAADTSSPRPTHLTKTDPISTCESHASA